MMSYVLLHQTPMLVYHTLTRVAGHQLLFTKWCIIPQCPCDCPFILSSLIEASKTNQSGLPRLNRESCINRYGNHTRDGVFLNQLSRIPCIAVEANFANSISRIDRLAAAQITMLPREAKMQYLLTLQVSRYRLCGLQYLQILPFGFAE